MDINIIETDRLILREITEEDADDIVRMRSEPDVYRYFKSPHMITIDEHLAWYRNSYMYNDNRIEWICVEKDNDMKIGVFGLIIIENNAEVSYILKPDARHRGYASEAVTAIIRNADKTLNIKHFIAEIHKENYNSISFVKKIGFRFMKEKGDFVIYQYEKGYYEKVGI